MSTRTSFRVLSGSGAPWRVGRRRTGTTTARGQDKRRTCAAVGVLFLHVFPAPSAPCGAEPQGLRVPQMAPHQ